MMMIMSMTLTDFQVFDISLVSSVGCQVFIYLNSNILKATVFEQGTDRLLTNLHVVDML